MTLVAGTKTELETSVYGQTINRVITDILALSLPAIGSEVYFLKRAWHDSLSNQLPCCTVSWAPETSTDSEGPVNLSVVHYRIMVAMVWAADRNLLENAGDELLAREKVAQAFRKTRPEAWTLTGASLRKTTVVAGEPLIRDAVVQNLDAQFLIIDVEVSELIP